MGKYLFIGGVADGQRLEVQDHLLAHYVAKPAAIDRSPPEVVREAQVQEFEAYTRVRWGSDGFEIECFALRGGNVLRALFENYRPGPVLTGRVELMHDQHALSVEVTWQDRLPMLYAGRNGQTVQVVFPVNAEGRGG